MDRLLGHLTFTHGFLIGQLSMVLIGLAFVRYLILETGNPTAGNARKRAGARTSRRRSRRGGETVQAVAQTSSRPSLDALLQKTLYDISSHPAESMDWLNVILAQAIQGYRQDLESQDDSDQDIQGEDDAPVRSRPKGWKFIQDVLNGDGESRARPSFLDHIELVDVQFGQEYPIFSNARLRPSHDEGQVRAEFDLDFRDSVVLGIETKILVNWPRPRFAILPISLSVSIEKFSATVMTELHTDRSKRELHLSLHPDYSLSLSIRSLFGSKAKLENLPKIEQLINERIRLWLSEQLAWPRYQAIKMPSLWPQQTRVREVPKADMYGPMPSRPSFARAQTELRSTLPLHGYTSQESGSSSNSSGVEASKGPRDYLERRPSRIPNMTRSNGFHPAGLGASPGWPDPAVDFGTPQRPS